MPQICYGCMNPVNDTGSPCPDCGFYLPDYQGNENALTPGTILNQKYLVGRTLGTGGFGITYLARDMYLQTKIAIKEFYPAHLVNRNTSASGDLSLHTFSEQGNRDFKTGMMRYIKEAEILSAFFNLPGIVSVKDFFYENGTAYIVMEYVDGISLKEYINQKGGKLTVNETLNIMKPILASLEIIHGSHVLHRDISPDNIMISRNGEVKLIDFGAAREYDDSGDKSMTVVLKRGYAPVEQYAKNGEQGVWTDIYGICATMYRMLSGEAPCESVERMVQEKIISIRKHDRKIPRNIAAAVMKGLSVRSQDRQQSVRELYDQLYNTQSYIESRKRKRTAVLTVILASMICILVIGGAVLYKLGKIRDQNRLEAAVYAAAEETEKEAAPTEAAGDAVPGAVEKNAAEESIPGEKDESLDHSIMVARDGIFTSANTTMTVGEIFDEYSDISGVWDAERDENGDVYVYYTGKKKGRELRISFFINKDDTFRIVGVMLDGESVSDYKQYVKDIIKEAGV